MIEVRAELGFDSIRVYLQDKLHIDIRRSTYRGSQAWMWPSNYKIEFYMAGCSLPMVVEYTSQETFFAVLTELAKLPLSGE